MRILMGVDPTLFQPSEFGTFSPHSMMVDIGKYKELTKEAKEILYRPPRVKHLYDKFWKLAVVCGEDEKVEQDREILTDHKVRYPKKTKEEQQVIDSLLEALDHQIEEDNREI